jgi:hypothetical protein
MMREALEYEDKWGHGSHYINLKTKALSGDGGRKALAVIEAAKVICDGRDFMNLNWTPHTAAALMKTIKEFEG